MSLSGRTSSNWDRVRRALARLLDLALHRSRWTVTMSLVFCGLVLTQVGCGYNVGSQFSQEIRSVSVSIAKSESGRRGLELQVTEAVQKQIQQRSHFRIAPEDEADTNLVLTFMEVQKGGLGQTQNSDARELQMTFRVKAEWVDRRSNEILRERGFDLPNSARVIQGQSEFAPEIGQSRATAEHDAIDRLARNVINMMETPW